MNRLTLAAPTEHFPTPWRMDPHSFSIYAQDVPKGPARVADMRGWGYLTGKGHGALALPEALAVETQKANAAFIVLAVNNHDALVKALQSASQQCGNVIFNCEQRPADNERHLSSWRGVKEYIDAALKWIVALVVLAAIVSLAIVPASAQIAQQPRYTLSIEQRRELHERECLVNAPSAWKVGEAALEAYRASCRREGP